jgi:microcystin-dependent protein
MTTTGYKISSGADIGTIFATSSSGTPSGSIVAYLGTTDIEGWIICNGVTRTNNSDSRYNTLNSLGIGSGGSGTTSFTPPNLQNYFLYGASVSSELKTTSGVSSVTLSTANIPSHSHTGTTSSTSTDHTHTSYSADFNININQGDGGGSGSGHNRNTTTTTSATTSGVSANSSHTHSFTTGNTGSGSSFSIIPSHYKVNYIIKL